MSFKKSIISSVAALAILSGTANAAIEVDGTGDYLIMPAYYAIGTWSTDLKVVNVNTTHAVVAKVVVREHDTSEELFDFPIYLTPGDVWYGTLKEEGGNIVLTSTDDSMILLENGQMNQASLTNPITIDTGKPAGTDYPNWTGYVETFGLASYAAIDFDTNWQVGSALDKEKFFMAVRSYGNGGQDLNDTAPSVDDVNNDMLMGKQTIFNVATTDSNKRAMALNATALGDVSTAAATSGVIGGDTTLVNSTASETVAKAAIDGALSKDLIYVMYEGNGDAANPIRIHFTDTLKKYLTDAEKPTYGYVRLDANTSKPWTYEYSVEGRDNSEESTCNPPQEGDISGSNPLTYSCEYNTTKEIHTISNTDEAFANYDFPVGGYVEYNVSNYTTIIPTSFTATDVDGFILNNHLYNQFKAGNMLYNP